jgi:Holliday junction resolvase
MGRLRGPHQSSSKRHHRDTAHKPIARVLEQFGFSVVDTSAVGPQVPGFPDMVAGMAGQNFLIQAKTGEGANFTPAEVEFSKNWRGEVVVLASEKAAIEWATRTRHELRRQSEAKALTAVRRVHPA